MKAIRTKLVLTLVAAVLPAFALAGGRASGAVVSGDDRRDRDTGADVAADVAGHAADAVLHRMQHGDAAGSRVESPQPRRAPGAAERMFPVADEAVHKVPSSAGAGYRVPVGVPADAGMDAAVARSIRTPVPGSAVSGATVRGGFGSVGTGLAEGAAHGVGGSAVVGVADDAARGVGRLFATAAGAAGAAGAVGAAAARGRKK